MHGAMRIVIAEDQGMLREVIVKICREAGHEVAGECGGGRETVAACLATRPELLILDLRLSDDFHGGAVLEALEAERALPKVLVLSAYLGDYLIHRIRHLPVPCGFVDKTTALLTSVGEAIAALEAGRMAFSAAFLRAYAAFRENGRSFDRLLTPHEELFLRYAVQEYSDSEIAVRLRISVRTAEGRRSALLHKLGLESSQKLVSFARAQGFHLFPPLPAPKWPGLTAAPTCEFPVA